MKILPNCLKIFFLFIFSIALVACGSQESIDSSKADTVNKATKDYDLLIYNSDEDIGESFENMCTEYGNRTGVVVKSITPVPPEENSEELLNSYMNSSNPPDIFSISGISELEKWKNQGKVLDFSNASVEEFKSVANAIPDYLRLSSNTVDSFGLPATVSGFGFLIDPKMLSSLFGGEKYKSILTDLESCPYDEFESFVNAIKMYISNDQIYEFQLNNKIYSLLNKKSGLSENLNGVFSYSANDNLETGTYVLNPALCMIFNSSAEANIISNDKMDSVSNILVKFAESLDLITSNVGGKSGTLSRGADFIDSSVNSRNQAIKNFANGKTLFLLGSDYDYNKLSILNSSVAKRSIFIPIKIPILSKDDAASSTNLKLINTSITINAPRYFAINAESSEKEKKLAQDFLVWYKTSELAEKFIIQDFKYIPYDIRDSNVIDNPISRSMIKYLSSGHVIPNVCDGVSSEWRENNLAKYITEQYFIKPSWTFADYLKVSEYGISKWDSLKLKS